MGGESSRPDMVEYAVVILELRQLGRLKQKDKALEVNLGYTWWDPDPENTNFKRHLSLHLRIASICLSRKNPVTSTFVSPGGTFLGSVRFCQTFIPSAVPVASGIGATDVSR